MYASSSIVEKPLLSQIAPYLTNIHKLHYQKTEKENTSVDRFIRHLRLHHITKRGGGGVSGIAASLKSNHKNQVTKMLSPLTSRCSTRLPIGDLKSRGDVATQIRGFNVRFM